MSKRKPQASTTKTSSTKSAARGAKLPEPGRAKVSAVLSNEISTGEQSAFRIESASVDGRLQIGDHVFTVKFPNRLRDQPLAGDVLLMRLTPNERREGMAHWCFTLKRAVIKNDCLILEPMFDIPAARPDVSEEIVGLAVGLRRDFI